MTTISELDDYVDILGPEDKVGPGRRSATGSRKVARSRELPPFIARPYALVRAIPDVGTYLGVVLIVVGFVLIAICWGKVAGLLAVGLQMPYLASAGMTGLGLIVTGIAVVSAAAREKDAALRKAQLSELAGTLRELRLLLNEPAAKALFAPAAAAAEPAVAEPAIEPAVAEPAAPEPVTESIPTISDTELTSEIAAVIDEPAVRRPVKVTGRSTRATSRAPTSRATASRATTTRTTAARAASGAAATSRATTVDARPVKTVRKVGR